MYIYHTSTLGKYSHLYGLWLKCTQLKFSPSDIRYTDIYLYLQLHSLFVNILTCLNVLLSCRVVAWPLLLKFKFLPSFFVVERN